MNRIDAFFESLPDLLERSERIAANRARNERIAAELRQMALDERQAEQDAADRYYDICEAEGTGN